MDRDAFKLSSEKDASARNLAQRSAELAMRTEAAIRPNEGFRTVSVSQRQEIQNPLRNGTVPPPPPKSERTFIGPPQNYGFDSTKQRLGTQPVGGGGGLSEYPFQLIQVDSSNIKVRYGTVANLVPTDVNTNIDVSGTDGTWTFWIDATLDADGLVTSAAVGYATTGLPTDDSDSAYLLIGEVTVASSAITAVSQAVMFSMGFVACGRDSADTATTPGTYYFFVGSSSNVPGAPP